MEQEGETEMRLRNKLEFVGEKLVNGTGRERRGEKERERKG